MDTRVALKRKNPWEKDTEDNEESHTADVMHYTQNLARKRPKFWQCDVNKYLNIYLRIHIKRAALVASPFVVSLASYSGEKELNQGSGIIIATDDTNIGIVFTSANLIRQPTDEYVAENKVADDLKVKVTLADGISYEGEVCAHDFHYNLAAIKFTSHSVVPCAQLKRVDDSLHLNPSQCQETPILVSHSSSVSISPGDAVVVVGRHFDRPYDFMAKSGVISLDCCDYDCKELFKATCKMTMCGDGGPLLNLAGDVIGIAFYDDVFTPFLPINIVYKWWEHYKKFGEFCRPFVGIEATNFYAADLYVAEKIIRTFPSISKGLIVEKVMSGSSAYAAGLRLNDVIIQCGGKVVQSFLEFLEIIWDNVGHPVELVVARPGYVTLLHLKMMVAEVTSYKLNCWPRWERW